MKNFKIKIVGFIMLAAFAFLLAYFVDITASTNNLLGYLGLFALYFIESIRAYYEGLTKGVEIVREIRNES